MTERLYAVICVVRRVLVLLVLLAISECGVLVRSATAALSQEGLPQDVV